MHGISSCVGSFDERFQPLLTNTCATVATAVDPQFKRRFFPSYTVSDKVKRTVRDVALVAAQQQREAAVEQQQPTVCSHSRADETKTPSASTSSSNTHGTYAGFTTTTTTSTTTNEVYKVTIVNTLIL